MEVGLRYTLFTLFNTNQTAFRFSFSRKTVL